MRKDLWANFLQRCGYLFRYGRWPLYFVYGAEYQWLKDDENKGKTRILQNCFDSCPYFWTYWSKSRLKAEMDRNHEIYTNVLLKQEKRDNLRPDYYWKFKNIKYIACIKPSEMLEAQKKIGVKKYNTKDPKNPTEV